MSQEGRSTGDVISVGSMPYLLSAGDRLGSGRAYRPHARSPAEEPRSHAQVSSALQRGVVVFAKPPSFLVEAVAHIRGRHQPVTIISLDKSLANE